MVLMLVAGCDGEDPSAWRAPLAHTTRSRAVQIVPPIALPRPTPRSDVEIWLSLPPGSALVGSTDAWTYPVGTVVDRVEFRETGTGRRVVDVRGTSVREGGALWHHVYRPVSDDPAAALRGAAWPSDDPEATEQTLDELMVDLRALGVTRTDAIRAKLDCNSCHVANRPDNRVRGEHGLVARGTDASGFFTMPTLFDDDAPLESYGVDPNLDSPFVTVRCEDGPVLRTDKGTARCAGAAVPRASRDLAVGTTASDPYTAAVLQSRAQVGRLFERAL